MDTFHDVILGDPNMRAVKLLLQRQPRLSFHPLRYDCSRNPLDYLLPIPSPISPLALWFDHDTERDHRQHPPPSRTRKLGRHSLQDWLVSHRSEAVDTARFAITFAYLSRSRLTHTCLQRTSSGTCPIPKLDWSTQHRIRPTPTGQRGLIIPCVSTSTC